MRFFQPPFRALWLGAGFLLVLVLWRSFRRVGPVNRSAGAVMDKLQAIRARLTALGTTWRFSTRVDDFMLRDGAMAGLLLHTGERLEARHVVLATGPSARDIWERLHALGFDVRIWPMPVTASSSPARSSAATTTISCRPTSAPAGPTTTRSGPATKS